MADFKICCGQTTLFNLPDPLIAKLIAVGNEQKAKYGETVEIQTKHPLQLGLCRVLADRFHD